MRSLRDMAIEAAESLRDTMQAEGLINDRAGLLAPLMVDVVVGVTQAWLDQQEVRHVMYRAMAETGRGGPMRSAQQALLAEAARTS